MRNRYGRVIEISMQIFYTEMYRLVSRILNTVSVHILYQFQNGEENRVGVRYISTGLTFPTKGDVTEEWDEDVRVQNKERR